MKILVTAANGYIGRHVVKALLDKSAEVIACDIVCNDVDERAECRTLNLFELPEGMSDIYLAFWLYYNHVI